MHMHIDVISINYITSCGGMFLYTSISNNDKHVFEINHIPYNNWLSAL